MNAPASPLSVWLRLRTIPLVHLTAVSGALLWTIQAQPSARPDTSVLSEPAIQLEPYKVTGSHVPRVDYETPSPVLTYTAEEIDVTGHASFGEFVQSLSFNNAVSSNEALRSEIIGSTTANPRGLGPNRFLTLINGRRAIPYALTSSGATGASHSNFNFNSIPAAAVERVEYLKDGASAIYGSDAITGVMNIILKKNFSGVLVDFNVSNALHHDSLNRRESITAGFARDGWQVLAILTHQVRHSNYIQDFGTHSTDYSYLGAKGRNFFSTNNQPSYVTLTADQAAGVGIGPAGVYVIADGLPTANPAKSSFVWVGEGASAIPRRSLMGDIQYFPDMEQTSGMMRLERKLTPNLTAFAQVIASRSRTYYDYGPARLVVGGYTLAANNPYNPFGIPLTIRSSEPYAFTIHTGSLRVRREVPNSNRAFLAGLHGTGAGTWQWESALSYGSDRTMLLVDVVRPEDLQAALAGTTRATAFNPFGPSEGARIFTRIANHNDMVDGATYDLTVTGRPWRIPLAGAGDVGIAAGYEFRYESVRGHPDEGNYLAFPTDRPFYGRHHAHAAYVEFALPLQRWFEVDLAARHDRYSDFGPTTQPKYSAKLNLPKNKFINVLLRGSYSESFKAPELTQLYERREATLVTVTDRLRPQDGARQVTQVRGGNSALQPEEGAVRYGGAVFEVPAINGLSFTADYLEVEIRNVIATLTYSYLNTPEGQRNYPLAIVRNNQTENPGPITMFNLTPESLGLQIYRGWDFGARYLRRTQRFGTFSFKAEATYMKKRGIDAGLGAGFRPGLSHTSPDWRANYGVSWRNPTWTVAVTSDVIGKLHNRTYSPEGWGENIFPVVNTSIRWRGIKKTTLSLGVNNLFNHRPAPNGYDPVGFSTNGPTAIYAVGTMINARVQREF